MADIYIPLKVHNYHGVSETPMSTKNCGTYVPLKLAISMGVVMVSVINHPYTVRREGRWQWL